MTEMELIVFRDKEDATKSQDPRIGDADWNPGGRRSVRLTIVAQDPSVRRADGSVVTAEVSVPSVRVEPGPRSHRFHVVNYDPESGRVGAPLLTYVEERLADKFPRVVDATLGDHAFHAQNMYAIAARTLERFESALGRRLGWGFGSHQLYLVPHAMREPNAFYSDDDDGLFFGFFTGASGQPTYAALSHDVVAHETSHAILDGLRHGFIEPGLPDQAAFHEAFADIVALLSVFSIREVVEYALDATGTAARIPVAGVTPDALSQTILFGLAEQFGRELSGREQSLRESIKVAPTTAWINDPRWEEPHRRGEILVAAVMRSLLEVWSRRLTPIVAEAQTVDRARVAEEGAKAADHLLTMVIRAIDYTPPGEFEFADFLDALITSDNEVAPDDRYNYRKGLLDAFGSYGISLPERRIVYLAGEVRPAYDYFNYEALRTQSEEAFRFLWENAGLFEIPTQYYTHVDDIDLAVRAGIDGFVVREAVVTYSQLLEASAQEMVEVARKGAGEGTFRLPEGLDPSTPIQIRGCGTVIFDQFGRPKYHQAKPLLDWDRQSRRLAYLFRRGISDTSGRFGFSTGAATGERFLAAHRPDQFRDERW